MSEAALYAVECRPGGGWAAFSVDLAGGIGPQASQTFDHVREAEAWARGFGQLADPFLEAA